MKPWFRAAMVIAVLAPVAGCSFYFGDDSGDDVCAYADQAVPFSGYRNPDNGNCEYTGGSGGCGAVDTDSNGFSEGAEAAPDWATCASGCEDLGEGDCLAAAQCRGIYTWLLSDSDTDCAPESSDCGGGNREFTACWGMAPSGPATGESCDGLDAYNCSRHDDCIAIYNWVADGSGDDGLTLQFSACQPEPVAGVCDSIDCGIGSHCEEQCDVCEEPDGDCDSLCEATCVPDYDSCDAIDCGTGYECQEVCSDCDPSDSSCEGGTTCEPQCVPIETGTCEGVDCGDGAHCELQCYPDPEPTDPDDPAVPPGPTTMDECYPVCVSDAPACDVLILCAPGTHCEENCSLECTPDGDCAPPVCTAECVPDGGDTCESLTTEEACVARADCIAVYTGDNCTCYPSGCVCEVLEYARCETSSVDDPATGVSSPLPRVLARHE